MDAREVVRRAWEELPRGDRTLLESIRAHQFRSFEWFFSTLAIRHWTDWIRGGSGMESMKLPAGYLLPEGKTMADIRRIDLELLASEGLDVEQIRPPSHPARAKTPTSSLVKPSRAASPPYGVSIDIGLRSSRGRRASRSTPALFAMFAVSEIHRFAGGNGRVSRALFNAELSAAGQYRIVIPLCFRADYLGAIRAMSRQANPEPLLRMADRAQRWSSLVDWSTMPRAIAQLEATNALVAPDKAEERGLLLRDPM